MSDSEFEDRLRPAGKLVQVSRRVRAPQRFYSGNRGGQYFLEALVNVSFHGEWVNEENKYEITKLEIFPMPHAEPISSQLIRKIPVATLFQNAISSHVSVYGFIVTSPQAKVQQAFDVLSSIRDNAYHLRELGPSSQDLLESVAVVYEIAGIGGAKPTQKVSSTFKVSLRTASNWVRAAREAGVLDDG